MNRKDQSSAIYRHSEEQHHEMDWQGAEVKYKGKGKSVRLFLEAWASDENSVNRCVSLNPIYKGAKDRLEKLHASRQ